MRYIGICLVCLACLVAELAWSARAEEWSGIYVSERDTASFSEIVLHKDGWAEMYGNAKDLPENTCSLGYIEFAGMASVSPEGNCLVLDHTNEIQLVSGGILIEQELYRKKDTSSFFPSQKTMANETLGWENDELGTLIFLEDGTVISETGETGWYELGHLHIRGRMFLVQCSVHVWTEDNMEVLVLSDQTLTLYEIRENEAIGRLLLISASSD